MKEIEKHVAMHCSRRSNKLIDMREYDDYEFSRMSSLNTSYVIGKEKMRVPRNRLEKTKEEFKRLKHELKWPKLRRKPRKRSKDVA